MPSGPFSKSCGTLCGQHLLMLSLQARGYISCSGCEGHSWFMGLQKDRDRYRIRMSPSARPCAGGEGCLIRWADLDHGVHIGYRQIALDYAVCAAHLRLQLLCGPGQEHLRLQRHHARNIAPWQQPLHCMTNQHAWSDPALCMMPDYIAGSTPQVMVLKMPLKGIDTLDIGQQNSVRARDKPPFNNA